MSTTGTQTQSQTEVGAEVNVGAWAATYNFVANETATFLLNYIDHRGLGIDKLVDMRDDLEDGIWAYLSSGHLTRVIVEVYPKGGGELEERFDMKFDIKSPDDVTKREAQEMNERKFQSHHEDIMEKIRDYDPPSGECTYRILIGYRSENDLGESPPELENWSDAAAKSTEHLEKNELGDAVEAGPVHGAAEFYI